MSDLVTGLNRPTGLAVAGGQLYWNDWNTFKTQRANFDGSGVITLFTGPLCGKNGLAVDLASGRVFVAEGTPGAEAVVRTNLDGTGRTVFRRTGFPGGVALDLANGHVYSGNADAGPGPLGINRQNLDGTGFTNILPLEFGARGIALDLSASLIYFTTVDELDETIDGSVRRVNFDGSGLVTLVSGLNFPHGIALDLAGGEMFWADIRNGVIQRANLNGTSVTTLVSGINRPHGIALQLQLGIQVDIDIKPGSDPNSINLGSAGKIPVAILSTPTFDAPAEVDPDTLRLAGATVNLIGKSDKFQCSNQDVNADGLLDLVCHFETLTLFLLEPGDTVAVIEGETFDGAAIRGEDSVKIVP